MADPGERIDVDDGTARIELRRRKGPSLWASIDTRDLEQVQQYRWHIVRPDGHRYVETTLYLQDGRRRGLYLHRFLMDAPAGAVVDHIDHDGLNNRRSNLRLATHGLNLANSRPVRMGTSRFKGVSKRAAGRTGWASRIKIDGRAIWLGIHLTEDDAARAYDTAALDLFGEFACLNFPRDTTAA